MHQSLDFPGVRWPGTSQAVRAGDWVTVSGQLAFKDGKLIGENDPHAQALQCFANLSAALSLAGAGFADVVKLTCFATSHTAYAGYAAIKATLFTERPPAGTAVIVAALLVPGALLEVEALAYVGQDLRTGR
ncbi:MAG TPA: RidA family protein [Steroidobacteraceae bacterium]|nr:RidA family protein [Steroidobacteraceae bacterium]